ncbi:MAG: Kelch repeat-containing protein [Thermoplasmata archaeon]
MDALYRGTLRARPAAAIFSIALFMGLGWAAPYAYTDAPIDREVDLGPAPVLSLAWFDAAPMAYPRSSPQVVELPDGDILVIGGLSADGPTSTTEVYDPESDSWAMGPRMSVARVGHTATLLEDGTVLVTGGETGSGTASSAEVIDLSLGACVLVGGMSFARQGHAAVPLTDGRVLVTGGTDWFNGVWGYAEAYVPSSHSFEPAGTMARERVFLTLQPLPDGRVLAIGGDEEGTSETFDPGTNTWGSLAQMTSARYNAASVALGDGRVLSAGGVSADTVLSSAEVYSPEEDSWVAVEGMSSQRASFGLAVIPGGMIVATGSWSELGASSAAEGACPCDLAWRGIDPMESARGRHGTAVTSNGTVLAIGGWDGSSALSSVERLVEVQAVPEPEPGMCEPMDLYPLVVAVADELEGFSENGLIAKLFVAQAAYECGRTDLCLNVMDAFHRQVRASYQSGHLGEEGASTLYEGYAGVVECLGGEPLPPVT